MLTERVHIAVPTAFFEDESINIEGTIRHIHDLYSQGVKSVLVCGTTGEQHSLNLQEKYELINGLEDEKTLVENMEIIFGVASTRQKIADELAERIRYSKIHGIMIGYPPYIRRSQEEAINYTRSLVRISGKPAILYNNPGRTGFDLAEESMIQLSKMDAVIGVKDAGGIEKVGRIKHAIHRKDFHFYAGGEEDLKQKLSGGYDRLSSIAGNVAPKLVTQWFYQILGTGELEVQEMKTLRLILEKVYQGNAILNVKKILNEKGLSMGSCRGPIGNLFDGKGDDGG